MAAGLRSAGVAAGDYVIICGDKSIIAYSLILGTMFTGATVVLFPVPRNVFDQTTIFITLSEQDNILVIRSSIIIIMQL